MVETLPPDSAKTYSEMFRIASTAQDVADYHDAIAGRDVGRIGKNFTRPDADPQTGEKSKEASSRLQHALDWLLLNDANYATVHNAAMRVLVDAENSVADGLTEIVEALANARRTLEEMEDRAARLADGTLVFRNASGDVLTVDSHPVPDEDAAGVEWTGAKSTYEEYRAQRDRIEGLERAERELRGIETELGDIRGELTDQQEPPSEDRVGELEDRASELGERIDAVRAQVEQSISSPEQNVFSSELNGMDTAATSATVIPSTGFASRP